jgi:hypothetical protein
MVARSQNYLAGLPEEDTGMARKRRKQTARQEPLSQGETWEVGLCRLTVPDAMSAAVDETPMFYVAVQTGESGGVVQAEAVPPGDGSSPLADFVQQAMRQPLIGQPRRPERIRVGSQEEAEMLAASLAKTGIALEVSTQLAGLERVHDQMEQLLGVASADYRTQAARAGETLDDESLREFFRVARRFYRQEMWDAYGDEALFEFTFEPAQGPARTLYGILMGSMGEEFGLVLFFSQDDLERFYTLSAEHLGTFADLSANPEELDFEQFKEQADMASQLLSVPSLSLSYTPQADVFPALAQEAQSLKLPLARKSAFPLVMRTGQGRMQVATASGLADMYTALLAILDWDKQLDKLGVADEFDHTITSKLKAIPGFTPALTAHTTLQDNPLAQDDEPELDEESMADLKSLFESMLQRLPEAPAPKKKASKGKQVARKAATSSRIYTLDVHLVDGPFFEEPPEQDISRQIAIRGHQTLHDLHRAIFDAFERWEEHLYEFNLGAGPADRSQIYFFSDGWDADEDGSGDPETTRLDELDLEVGRRFGYTFDMGDEWQHIIEVIAVTEGKGKGKYPRVVKKVGEAPPQYPEDDEDWDEE